MLFLLFILVPLLEIYLFIRIGGVIGAMPTVLLVVLTAIIGVRMLRVQGMNAWGRFHDAMARGESPAFEMLEGVILLFGGALLLTPGFFTDAVGFLCLLRTTRTRIVQYLVARAGVPGLRGFVLRRRRGAAPGVSRGDTLEGEFRGRDLDE